MPFKPLVILPKQATSGVTGVKATLRKGRTAAAQLILSVTGAAFEKLQWKDGSQIEVLVGDGADHGLLRLRQAKVGQVFVDTKPAPAGGKPYMTLRFGHQPDFVDRAEKAQWCQWEILEDGWVEVVLPEWADETGPTKKTRISAPPAAPRPCLPAFEPRRRGWPPKNVTAAVLGDPAPGRRQLPDLVEAAGKQ